MADGGSPVRAKLVLVTLRNQVIFPLFRSAFEVNKRSFEQAQKLIDQKKADGLGAIALRPAAQGREAVPFQVGTQCSVVHVEQKQDKDVDNEVSQMLMDRQSVLVSVEGGARFKVLHSELLGHVELAEVEFLEDKDDEKDLKVRALVQSVQEKMAELVSKNSPENPIFRTRRQQLQFPITATLLTSFVGAALMPLTIEERQQILETVGLKQRLELVLDFLQRESQAMRVSTQISESIQRSRDQEMKMMALQRQAQEIQRELQRLQQKKDKHSDDEGHSSEEEDELTHLGEKLSKANLPEDAKRIAKKELKRLKSLQAHHPEYTSTHSYLELLASLPWNTSTKESFDLQGARRLLDEDHRGLEKVKIRILEFLAVQKLRGNMKGPILCLHGPPGIGKTSLGRSIARAIGRKFHRIALGGVRDEAELRGHRRTYIGSIPGVIIQAFQTLGVNNPVILLDEVDKTSQNSMFNPQATLLEILDPEQNTTFKDHYLNTPFDLSNAIFICMANDTSTIDRPLLDRMEVIDLSGYTVEEKVAISRSHLLPKQRKLHALEKEESDVKPILDLTNDALEALVTRWTAESGVRSLERHLAQICRWAALRLQGVDVLTGLGREAAREAALASSGPDSEGRIEVTAEHLPQILGVELFEPNLAERLDVGVSMGLSVSSVGGQLLFIEATKIVGSGKLTVTGQLGKVMLESVETALSLLRSRFVRLSQSPGPPQIFNFETGRMELAPDAVDEKDPFKGEDIHVHFPAGGIPKDGPSAGVAVLLALASLILNRPVRSDTAVTGEVTLRGHVLPVGGIRDKVLAAIRGGVKHVLLPVANKRHVLEDIPAKSLEGVEIHYLKTVDEALDWVFGSTLQVDSGVSANEATEGRVAPFSMRSRL